MAKRTNNQNQSLLDQEPTELRYERLHPAERSLIYWSLGLGAALMLVLAWVSYAYFPAG